MKRYLVAFLALALLCTGLAGCGMNRREEALSGGETPEGETTVREVVRYAYRLRYVEPRFVPEENRAAWRGDLLALVSNEAVDYYEGDGPEGCNYPDPGRPGIPRGWHLGLLDVDLDGTPELLVDMGGGSAGNAFYIVYDIQSGRCLGSMDGGHDGSWCVYFNTLTGAYESIGQYQWRFGAAGKGRFINRVRLVNTVDGERGTVSEEPCFYTAYTFHAVVEEPRETGAEALGGEPGTHITFQLAGEAATMEAYFEAYDTFVETCIRIPETGLVCIERGDYDSPEAVVDALLSTGQAFIAPEP